VKSAVQEYPHREVNFGSWTGEDANLKGGTQSRERGGNSEFFDTLQSTYNPSGLPRGKYGSP
jgi:hypothetical protein